MLFERVKELSEQRGENLKTVAIKLGFSENAFYKWKIQSPKSETLEKVADYFNVTTDYLLGRSEEKILSKVEFDEKTRSIARDFQDLDDESQDLLHSLIKSMSNKGKEAKRD